MLLMSTLGLVQSSKQKVIKKTPIFFRLFMTQGRCSSGANLLLRSRGGAPEQLWLLRSQGRSSSGARLGAPDEHPWVGAPQEEQPGSARAGCGHLPPPHSMSHCGTITLCQCRVALRSHYFCSDSGPPMLRRECLSGYTHTRPVCMRKFCFVIFFCMRILGVQSFCPRVAPHSGRGKWSRHYMCCRPVYCLFAYFSGDAQRLHVYTLVHVPLHYICIQTRVP